MTVLRNKRSFIHVFHMSATVTISSIIFINLICFNLAATTDIYTLSLHDALPIYFHGRWPFLAPKERASIRRGGAELRAVRSEEHTSELQSPDHLVCRLLLEKKN